MGKSGRLARCCRRAAGDSGLCGALSAESGEAAVLIRLVLFLARHSSESWNPVLCPRFFLSQQDCCAGRLFAPKLKRRDSRQRRTDKQDKSWIPAFAGMTSEEIQSSGVSSRSGFTPPPRGI